MAQERHCKSAACWPLQAPCERVRRAGARLQVRPLRGLQAARGAASVAQERHCKSAACGRCKRSGAARSPATRAASGAGRRVRGAGAPLQVRGLWPLQAQRSCASAALGRGCKFARCAGCKRRGAPRPWRRSATASPPAARAARQRAGVEICVVRDDMIQSVADAQGSAASGIM